MLKLSGEALQGKQGFGIDYEVTVCWCTAQSNLPQCWPCNPSTSDDLSH